MRTSFSPHLSPMLPVRPPVQSGKPIFAATGLRRQTNDSFVRFSSETPWLEDAAYRLLYKLPKAGLHDHDSGCSDVPSLAAKLLRAILIDRSISTLEWKNPETGQYETVDFSPLHNPQTPRATRNALLDKLHQLMERQNIRNYYRVATQAEREKYFAPSDQLLGEDEAPLTQEEIAERQRSFRASGLALYRKVSEKINPLVKNVPAAYENAYRYAQAVAGEYVRYAEYRLSPAGYLKKSESTPPTQGFKKILHAISTFFNTLLMKLGIKAQPPQPEDTFSDEVEHLIRWVQTGFENAKHDMTKIRRDFDYGIIILLERQGPDKVENAIKMAQEAIRLRKAGYPIVGVDLAGDELNNPVTEFESAFQLVQDYNDDPATPADKRLGITIHAGETPSSGDLEGYQSIAEAIRIASSPNTKVRIGHGIQIINSSPELKAAFQDYMHSADDSKWLVFPPEQKQALLDSSPLLKQVVDNGIVLEMCPKSNVQTLAVPYHDQHPAVFLSRLGVKVSINTDNRTISNTNAINELVKLVQKGHANWEDIKRLARSGFEGAFIHDEQQKQQLLAWVNTRFKELETRFPDGIAILNNHQNTQPASTSHTP